MEGKRMAKNYKEMAQQILDQVGGKENVKFAANCMTRLRLTLKDNDLVNIDEVKKINGVLGAQFTGDQFQIIIGQDVPKVYDEVCNIGGFAKQAAIDENLDKEKEPLTFKGVINSIMDSITGVMTPVIPVVMITAMIKMAVALIGPDMLNVVSVESDIYRLLSFLGDVGFYFFPVLIGYTGALKFGCSPVLGIMLGAVLLHPSFVEIVNAGLPFKTFGIPTVLANYSNSFLPMLLATWIMSYVEKFFKKVIPTVLSTVFAPLCTFLVMVPITLCGVGPLGTILGTYVSAALMGIHDVFGPLGMALIGALWVLIVATGMHMAFAAPILTAFSTLGYDPTVIPATCTFAYTMMAITLAIAIKAKNNDDRSLAISCLASAALGGVSEPTIFGILLRYRKALLFAMAGGFTGAFIAGVLGAKGYGFASGNIISLICYGPDIVKGAIAVAGGSLVTFVLTMIFGYTDNKAA